MNTPFDIYVNQKPASEPAQTKSASDVVFEHAYWDEMAKQAATFENGQIENFFNAVFEDHTQKLASADPAYAAILETEYLKAAFNQSYDETVEAVRRQVTVR